MDYFTEFFRIKDYETEQSGCSQGAFYSLATKIGLIMYDFRPVRNEVCVYLKYHLELAVSGIFERREGSNDTNLKFQPQIMEKLRLLTLLFLTVVIAACQKDPTQNGSSDPDVVSFQGSVSFKTVDPAEKGLDLIWNADVDRIGLFAADGETVEHANIYYAAFSSAANTQFVCPSQDRRIVWSAGAASRDFYAYYPYRTTYDDLTAVPVAIAAKQKGAAGATKHLKQLVNLYAVSKGVKGPVETVSLPFESVAAVIELRLAADRTLSDVRNITLRSTDGGMLAFETGSLNLRNGAVTPGEQTAAEINYEIEGQATISRTPTSFFLAVNPVEAGKTLEVLVDYGEKHLSLGSVVVPESGIPGGKLTVFSLGYEFPQRIAEDLSANGTANTYLVTKPGTTYKFRATTKGNGVPRTYSYSVDGHPVTKSYSETDLAIKPMAAKLVWYNSPKTADGWVRESPVTIESVEYDDWEGNVYFTTPAEFVPGNALIAAYDAGGEVLWSWNIWAVENYDCDAEARQVGRYMMMDRNLGAMAGREAMNSSDKRVAAWALGSYYQWGRKDPFPAAAEYDDTGFGSEMYWGLPTYTPIEELQQDYSSESWGARNMMFGKIGANNAYAVGDKAVDDAVALSVKYPYRWMAKEVSGVQADNWHTPSYSWFNNTGSAENQTGWFWLWGSEYVGDNLKSIYDPCPAGWKVAPPEALDFALGSVAELDEKPFGRYSRAYDLYFPYTGQRQSAFNGSHIRSLTNKMLVLTSSSASGNYYPVQGSLGGYSSYNSYTGAGYQLRCVREQTTAMPKGRLEGPRAVLIGNSITEVWQGRTDNKTFFSDNDYLPKGISGQTSLQISARFYNDVIVNDPACVVIACGVNDLAENDGQPCSIERVFADIRLMAETGAARGFKVVIGSTPPANRIWWQSEEWNAAHADLGQRVVELNRLLKQYAEERGFVYADYHSALKDDQNGLKLEYSWTPDDRVHPSAAGYAVMEKILKKAVDKALFDPNATDGDGQIDDLDKWEGWE